MSMQCMYIIIDALRYDALSNQKNTEYLFPNLNRVINKGFLKKVIANAQSTQFVLPSLFSLTYPLDYGGYNAGIRNRPESYVESIKKSGYSTYLMACCNQMGIGTGYDRGFDHVLTTSDFRVLLEQKIHRTLLYEIELYKKNKQSKEEMLKVIKKEFIIVLRSLRAIIVNQDKSLWPKKLKIINERIAKGCEAEEKLLIENPELVAEKMWSVPAGMYWYLLGKRKPYPFLYFYKRIISAFSWRFKKIVSKQTIWPFLIYGHYPVKIGEMIKSICEKITSIKYNKWHMHLHIMDVHDCRSINQPFHILNRLKYFPKWFVARVTGRSNRRFLYDSAAMYVDEKLGLLFSHLEKEGILNNMTILITADHGAQFAESPRKKFNIGYRTHYEDIDIPLIMMNAKDNPIKGLHDSMSITASYLDTLGIELHKSYKGMSVFKGSKDAIISENCGHGNADLKRRDIYFTVTSSKFKMMTVLSGSKLKIDQLYNVEKDIKEINNLVNDGSYIKIINELKFFLYKERNELFKLRDVSFEYK